MLRTAKFRNIPFLHANQIEMLQLTYCILLVLQLILQNFLTQETEVLGFVFNFVAKKIKLTGCKNIRKISKILKLLYEEKKKLRIWELAFVIGSSVTTFPVLPYSKFITWNKRYAKYLHLNFKKINIKSNSCYWAL